MSKRKTTAARPFQFSDAGGFGFSPTLKPARARKFAAIGAPAGDNRKGDYSTNSSYDGGSHVGFGYDAVRNKGRRAMPVARTMSEDLELRQLPRRQLISGIRDLNRNFAICAWMIRRHLDYITTFHFRPKTGIKAFDEQLTEFMDYWSKPQNCDVAGRHSLPRLVRMWEMRRVIDGDVLVNRIADGHIQTIEGDRVTDLGGVPFEQLGIKDTNWVQHGVWTNELGRPKAYMVFKRQPKGTGLIWDRMVPAKFSDLFGYYDRIDQVRGISPLAAAANTLRDIYEGLDFALVKAKVSQFFAMLFTRQASEDLGLEPKEDESDPEADPDKPRYDVDMGRGPLMLDLEPGDEAKVIESATPSDQFQAFEQICIMIAMKALDLPFSFYDESHTNYSGIRMAAVQYYEAAAKIKQHDVRSLLDKQTRWRVGLAILDGDLVLPPKMDWRDIRWEWTHAGIPLFDPLKEISASVAAINAGLSSQIREAKKLGLDAFELIDERAEIEEYASKARNGKGVVLSTALASTAGDDPNKGTTQTETENVVENQDDGKPGSGGRQNIWAPSKQRRK